ncbi:hypothetical protein PUN28_014506 [Cardiocondyla obscurior]|uniref:Uncharacterized protein n=1 Tax=Cardiocondyla obscurior TaxID=286306 RepID=A0AAW2F0J1_9HYME
MTGGCSCRCYNYLVFRKERTRFYTVYIKLIIKNKIFLTSGVAPSMHDAFPRPPPPLRTSESHVLSSHGESHVLSSRGVSHVLSSRKEWRGEDRSCIARFSLNANTY